MGVDAARTLHTIVSRLMLPNTTKAAPANIHSDAVKSGPILSCIGLKAKVSIGTRQGKGKAVPQYELSSRRLKSRRTCLKPSPQPTTKRRST